MASQEVAHALLQDKLPRSYNEVIGDAVSLARHRLYAIYLCGQAESAASSAPRPGYETTVSISFQALGRVAEQYGLGSGSPEQRGRAMMAHFTETMRPQFRSVINPQMLHHYAQSVLKVEPNAFMAAIHTSFDRAYSEAVRQILPNGL